MNLTSIKTSICRLICPHAACEPNKEIEDRLDRAEQLHEITKKAASTEAASAKARVGDMRVVTNSAVKRLRHDRGEFGEVEQ
jgi:hypothetical protein